MDATITAKLIRGALDDRGIQTSSTNHFARKSCRKLIFTGWPTRLRIEVYEKRVEVWDLRPEDAVLAVDKNIADPDLIDSIVTFIDEVTGRGASRNN